MVMMMGDGDDDDDDDAMGKFFHDIGRLTIWFMFVRDGCHRLSIVLQHGDPALHLECL